MYIIILKSIYILQLYWRIYIYEVTYKLSFSLVGIFILNLWWSYVYINVNSYSKKSFHSRRVLAVCKDEGPHMFYLLDFH